MARILVFHAPVDAHHVEIFLVPALRRLQLDRQVRTEISTYDEFTALAGPGGGDLVILCRPRYPVCRSILAAAESAQVPSVVMIDDNWLAAGEEYPRYAGLFRRGAPAIEIFLETVRRASATITFNSLLAEDLRRFARRLEVLPPSLDPTPFELTGGSQDLKRLCFGYAGSERSEGAAFRALAALARRHADLRLLFIGHHLPHGWDTVAASVDFVPFLRDYRAYARELASRRPAVLVAPLEATRATASKCAIKLFDSAAVGAAGVFSRVAPYSSCIEHRRNGLLVDNDDGAWLEALEELYLDSVLRSALADAARTDLHTLYAPEWTFIALRRLLDELMGPTTPSSFLKP